MIWHCGAIPGSYCCKPEEFGGNPCRTITTQGIHELLVAALTVECTWKIARCCDFEFLISVMDHIFEKSLWWKQILPKAGPGHWHIVVVLSETKGFFVSKTPAEMGIQQHAGYGVTQLRTWRQVIWAQVLTGAGRMIGEYFSWIKSWINN